MRRLALLMAAGVLAPAPAGAQAITRLEAAPGEHAVDNSTQTEDVKFRNDANQRLTVAVDVAGRGPFRFLVDTGADRSAVSREVMQRLQLEQGPVANLHSATGISTVGTARIPHLNISQRRIQDVEAAVLATGNMGADGILGTDSLRAQRVLFDFRNKLLSITPATRPPPLEKDAIVIRAKRKSGRLIVTDAVADNRSLDVVIDTGAEVTIGNSALRQALLRHLRPNGRVQLLSVTGQVLVGDYLTLKELTLGGVTLRDLNIVFADAHTFKQMKLLNRPALLLGMNAMRAFDKVSIDFVRRKLQVVMPKGTEVERDQRLAMR